jgi:molecular chaperone GrpE
VTDKEKAPPASEAEPQPQAEAGIADVPAAPAPDAAALPVEPGVEPEAAGPEEEDPHAALQRALEEARGEAAEYLDGWQRARAELSNARKRFRREQDQAYANAVGSVLTRLLVVVDDFERAFAVPEDERELEPWVNGMALICRKLRQLLDQEGVTRIQTEGIAFDPHLHQAITHEPSDTVPEGTVLGEVRAGYQMNERVLRPALVRVSAGGPAEPEPAEDEEAAEAEA